MKKSIQTALASILLTANVNATAGKLPINEKHLERVSSTEALELKSARVIVDNDESFRTKLEAIRQAKTSIDMVYYIYADDFSSAVITKELMNKARAGVKVRLIVDYLTNLKRADLFLAMQRAGVQIKLYNKPSSNILRDAVYVSSPCEADAVGATCVEQKDLKSKQLLSKSNGTDFMSRLFLTGLYAKNVDLLKISVIEGQGLDLSKLSSGASDVDKKEQEQIREFGKLFYDAKVKGSIAAKFKLWLAFQIYGDEIAPIYNVVSESLPFDSEAGKGKDWAYLTDYVHHKLLLVDNKFVQLGGRNVEDSYHMKSNDLDDSGKKKYIFMDTDFAAEVSQKSGQELKSTYERIWGLEWMLSTLTEVDSQTELDALARIDLLAQATGQCKENSNALIAKSLCIGNAFKALLIKSESRSSRLDGVEKSIAVKAKSYVEKHKLSVGETEMINVNGGRLSANDLRTAKVYYIENLPFARPNLLKKILGKTEPVRQYGADLHNEYRSNKNIHELLVRGLENVCKNNGAKNSKEIVLHNAYFFPSPNVMSAFGKMLNGEWGCEGVTVTILTNSYETTDLFPVNAVASTQFKAIFDIYAEEVRKGNKRTADFRLLEYKKQSQGDERSLHSKVSLIGNDIMIGSANLDMRSYAMDTNNGVYITDANDLAQDYRNFVAKLVNGDLKDEKGQSKFIIQDKTQEMLTVKTKEQFIEEQLAIIKYAVSQYKSGRRLLGDEAKPETQAKYSDLLRNMMGFVYGATVGGIDSARIMPANGTRGVSKQELEKFQKRQQRKLENMIQDMLSTI